MTGAGSQLARVSLVDQIRDFLVLEIAQGRLAPGSPVRELEIAQQLGTSQTPVREAFRELTAFGLLESRIHVGTRVRKLEEEDLVDAVPVRAALEGLAGRLAAQRRDEPSDEIRLALAHMFEVARGEDRLEFASASTRFHRAIIATARNESLSRAWNALGIEVMTIMAMVTNDIPLDEAARSHQVVLDAIDSHDPDFAEQVLGGHVSGYLPDAVRFAGASGPASATEAQQQDRYLDIIDNA